MKKQQTSSWGRRVSLGLMIVVLFILLAILSWRSTQPLTTNQSESVPTLYLHGYGAGAKSTDYWINYAKKHDQAQKVLTAVVSPQGKVKLQGEWGTRVKHPLVQVVFQDNKNTDYQQTSRWFAKVLQALQQRYQIKQYNTVTHSMGNLTTMYYQMSPKLKKGLPKLHQQVNVAGHFDGIVGKDDQPNQNHLQQNGEPQQQDATYRYLKRNRQQFPKNVSVLNIYGNLDDGTNSDGDVTVVSAKSLGFLVKKQTHYQELEIKGAKAQHSQLHENPQVARAIDHFLWAK
ncbi:alpha/beta hydrolase [Bombilactobacillus folatiphilus]|uniref:Alpha/beta hydrolase n=1 Tax=Bombilactobacillus folatiphilus TaxID=2923362 RepID=A0ABY4P9L9_9LACO|nr:alpha/beta hydrolase [Bombilactobacillus folatiphilus]UQS82428.1 alpha/beta hydrolase [Bombilactobacillus folatiphilus]